MLLLKTHSARRLQAALTVLIVFVACMSLMHCAKAADDAILAIVNGQKLTERDLGFLYVSRRVPDEQRDSVRARFIDDLIERALLRQYLVKHKVEASKVLLDQQMARLDALFKEDGKQLDEALKARGYTRASFREELGLSLRWRAHALQALTADKIRDYWDKHRYEFDGTEVRAAQIVKRVPTDADSLRLQSELATLRHQIVQKELTFAEAAKKHSESPSADDGGDLGSFSFRGKMPVEISQVAFRLKPGEVSEPIQTRFGMHLITVSEVVAGDLSLEDARSEIIETLSQEMQRRLLKQLKSDAKIEARNPPQ